MEILLTQLEKKVTSLLAANERLRQQNTVLVAEKSAIEQRNIALETQNAEFIEQLQVAENKLFRLVDSMPTDDYDSAPLNEAGDLSAKTGITNAVASDDIEQQLFISRQDDAQEDNTQDNTQDDLIPNR